MLTLTRLNDISASTSVTYLIIRSIFKISEIHWHIWKTFMQLKIMIPPDIKKASAY